MMHSKSIEPEEIAGTLGKIEVHDAPSISASKDLAAASNVNV